MSMRSVVLRMSFVAACFMSLPAWAFDEPPSLPPKTLEQEPTQREAYAGSTLALWLCAGFDYNPTREAPSLAKRDAPLALGPKLAWQTFDASSPLVVYRLQATGDLRYVYYPGLVTRSTRELSGLFGDARLAGAARFGGTLEAGLVLHAQRTAALDDTDVAQTQRSVRRFADLGVVAGYRSPNGRVGGFARYNLVWNEHEDARLDIFTHRQHAARGEVFVTLGDRVRLGLLGAAIFTRYRLGVGNTPETLAHGDTNLAQARLSLSSPISEVLDFASSLGVASGFSRSLRDESVAVGAFRLNYQLKAVKVSVGAERLCEPTSIYSFATITEGLLGVSVAFAEATRFALEGRYGLIVFAGAEKLTGERRDTRGLVVARLAHRLTARYEVALSERFELRRSNFLTAQGDPSYNRSETILSFGVKM